MNSKLAVLNKIKAYDSIVIYGHRLPDGDCYGSQIALKEIIKENFPNKQVYIVGSGLPQFFDILGKMDEVSDEIIENSLALLTDISDLHRSEDTRIYNTKERIKIDHHIDETHFEGDKYVDEDAIATCLMIVEFAKEFNLKINKVAANALFLGIVTDSGRFQYQPLNKKTFELVASLFDNGLDTKMIYDALYFEDEKMLKYRGYMMLNYQKTPHGVVYLKVDIETYHKFGLKFNQVSNQVNNLGGIKDCPIWLLFTESDIDGTIRVEYRSNGTNVQEIAVIFGGGGHLNAAGSKISKEDGWAKVDEIINYCDKIASKGE